MDMTMRNFGYMVDTSIHHHVLAKTAFMPLMVMSLLPAASGRRFVTGVDSDSGIDLDNKPHSVLPEVSPGHNARLEAFNITPPVSDAVTPSSLNASSSMAHLHRHAQSEPCKPLGFAPKVQEVQLTIQRWYSKYFPGQRGNPGNYRHWETIGNGRKQVWSKDAKTAWDNVDAQWSQAMAALSDGQKEALAKWIQEQASADFQDTRLSFYEKKALSTWITGNADWEHGLVVKAEAIVLPTNSQSGDPQISTSMTSINALAKLMPELPACL